MPVLIVVPDENVGRQWAKSFDTFTHSITHWLCTESSVMYHYTVSCIILTTIIGNSTSKFQCEVSGYHNHIFTTG